MKTRIFLSLLSVLLTACIAQPVAVAPATTQERTLLFDQLKPMEGAWNYYDSKGKWQGTGHFALTAGGSVTLGKELARYGNRAAAIAPGYVSTEMADAIREDVRERIVGQIPLGRMASMEEISHALRFVLENDYVSGRVIEVDGAGRM